MHKIIVITGPTAVGKTKLSIELAKKYDGEIINADAVQVYKGLDIGSAKVTEEEKEGIPHHLLDFKEVTEEYTIYHYQKDCREKIKDIQSRNKTPILVGGTGLYIKAALYDYKLSEEKSTNTYDNLTNEELYEELKKLDKDIIIDKDNRRRLIRAINYYKENNESINKNKTNKLLYNVIFIGLTTDRQVLYDKINKRVDEMISQGLLEEVKSFYDKGIKSKPLLNAIGYRELYNYLDGNGRMARFWVSLILTNWNSKFEYIPIEEEIYLNQTKYYDSIAQCHINGNLNVFIDFMLMCINSALEKLPKKLPKK